MEVETIVLQKELMRDYLQQGLFQLLGINWWNESLSIEMLQQSGYFLYGLYKGRIVVAEDGGNHSVWFFEGVFGVACPVLVPTDGPGIFLRVAHVRKCRTILFEEGERHIKKLLLQFGGLPNLIFDCIEDVLFLHEAIIVDEVYLFLEVEDGQFFEWYIEDEYGLDCLSEKIEEGVFCQL